MQSAVASGSPILLHCLTKKSSWASLIYIFFFCECVQFLSMTFLSLICRFASILQIDQFFIRKKNGTLFILFFCSLNFLKLKVYYGQLNFEVLDEEYAYTVRNYSFQFLIIQANPSLLSLPFFVWSRKALHTNRKEESRGKRWVSVACVSIQNGGKSLIRK